MCKCANELRFANVQMCECANKLRFAPLMEATFETSRSTRHVKRIFEGASAWGERWGRRLLTSHERDCNYPCRARRFKRRLHIRRSRASDVRRRRPHRSPPSSSNVNKRQQLSASPKFWGRRKFLLAARPFFLKRTKPPKAQHKHTPLPMPIIYIRSGNRPLYPSKTGPSRKKTLEKQKNLR